MSRMDHINQCPYAINGRRLIPPPEGGVAEGLEDIDAPDSGRDESGVMNRIVLRENVGSWEFTYSSLSVDEYQYMCSVLPSTKEEKASFQFTHPAKDGSGGEETSDCYFSKRSVSFYSKRAGIYKDLKFKIIER